MGRWTQFDEDDYRLPEGFKRIGYDADEQLYYYYDEEGATWVSKERYGVMYPAKRPKHRAEAAKNPLYADDNDFDSEDEEEDSDGSGEDQATLFSDDGTLVPESSCDHGRKPSLTIPQTPARSPFDFLAAESISPAEPPPKGNLAFRNITRLIGGASAFRSAGKAIANKAHEIVNENAKHDESDAPTVSEKLLHSDVGHTQKEKTKLPASPITEQEKASSYSREASYPKEKDYYYVEHPSHGHHKGSPAAVPTSDLRRAVSMKEDKALPSTPGKANPAVQRSATQIHHSRAATTPSAKDSDHHHHHHTPSQSSDRKAEKTASHQSDVAKPTTSPVMNSFKPPSTVAEAVEKKKSPTGAGKDSPSKLHRRDRERDRNTASPPPVSPTTQDSSHKRGESAVSGRSAGRPSSPIGYSNAKPRKLEKRTRGSSDAKLEISAPIPVVPPKDSVAESGHAASSKESSDREKKDSALKRGTSNSSSTQEKKQTGNGGSLFVEGL